MANSFKPPHGSFIDAGSIGRNIPFLGQRTNFLWAKTLVNPLYHEGNKPLEQKNSVLFSDQVGG